MIQRTLKRFITYGLVAATTVGSIGNYTIATVSAGKLILNTKKENGSRTWSKSSFISKVNGVTPDNKYSWSIYIDENNEPTELHPDNIEFVEVYPNTNTGGSKEDKIFNVPSSITYLGEEYPVTRIDGVYWDTCLNIEEINIPEGVTYISKGAFKNIETLKKVSLPSTLKQWEAAFINSGVEEVKLANGLTSIYQNAFAGCIKLKHIEIPTSVKTIGENAFRSCPIENLNLKMGDLNYIEDGAFSSTIDTHVVIPEGVEKLGTKVFRDDLEEIVLPASLKELAYNAFSNYRKLKTVIAPQSPMNIGQSAFYGCVNLTELKIDGAKKIGDRAFSSCNKLKSVSAENCIIIGDNAFSGNEMLEKVNVGSSLKTVGFSAFRECKNLKGFMDLGDAIIKLDAFRASGVEHIKIGGNVETQAFLDCTSLKSVEFRPTSPISVGVQAFANCPSLKEIIVSNKVSSISKNAFYIDATTETNLYSDSLETDLYDWTASHRKIQKYTADEYDKNPTIIVQNKAFKKSNPTDVKFQLDFGRGTKVATDIDSVVANYAELDHNMYHLDGTNLVIKKEYLGGLKKGSYNIGVVFNNTERTSIEDALKISIINDSSDTSDKEEPPIVLDTKSYQFYKDYQKDVMIPIQMNSAKSLTRLYLGTNVIDPSKYSFKNDTIMISTNYLSTVDAGVYRIIPKFDNGTIINNIVLEVYQKYEDRLLPQLLPSYIVYNNQDLKLKVDFGEGSTQAEKVKLLIIDDKVITPTGEIYNITSYRKTNILHNMKSLANSALMFYMQNTNTLVLKKELIDKLGFNPGSEHKIGCIFENSEETASLEKVILVIPSSNHNNGGGGGGSSEGSNNNGSNGGIIDNDNHNKNDEKEDENKPKPPKPRPPKPEPSKPDKKEPINDTGKPDAEVEVMIPYMTTYKTINKGSKFRVILENASKIKSVRWTSSNKKVASVNKTGLIAAKKNGTATIKCVARNKQNKLYKFEVRVKVITSKYKTISKATRNLKYSSNFPVFVMDKTVYTKEHAQIILSNLRRTSKITYKSSDKKVASVNQKGQIKGIKKGTAMITVTVRENKQVYVYKLRCLVEKRPIDLDLKK